MSPHTLTDQY